MSNFHSEQMLHDRVNLARLVRRLEKTVSNEDWSEDAQSPLPTWIRTRGTLQKLKYARKLLLNVEVNEDVRDATVVERFNALRRTLDRLENVVMEVDKRVAPKSIRPEPILPRLPIPVLTSSDSEFSESAPESIPADPSATLLPAEETSSITAHDFLMSPGDTSPVIQRGPINPSATLLPTSIAKASSEATPTFLQNSTTLQEELSAQLAQMATQLKRNAQHFAGSLEKDKAVVLEAQEKLERNHDVMTKERVRLRDHSSKSWGTTWITILSLIVALVAFVLTFIIIRIT